MYDVIKIMSKKKPVRYETCKMKRKKEKSEVEQISKMENESTTYAYNLVSLAVLGLFKTLTGAVAGLNCAARLVEIE